MMRPVGWDELLAAADDLDEAVVATAGIDRFCSSSAWIQSASETLMPPRTSFVHRGDGGWLAAMRGVHASGLTYIEPLELAWGLASPLLGGDPEGLAEEAVALLTRRRRDFQVALVPGLAPDAPILRALLARVPDAWERRWGQATIRHVASLDGGVDGFLARRSRNFRKALRHALRAAAAAGITFESVRATDEASAARLYRRILAVEARSWKARDGVGIERGPMHDFYQAMVRRLAGRGRQRTLFARAGGDDVAYVLGAVFAGEYRGLQFSYDDALARHSLGSLCQYHQIARLAAEGVERYDLGTDMDYKRRWAEDQLETELLVLIPR
jgi:Acetyltransferase (GNAT) domain